MHRTRLPLAILVLLVLTLRVDRARAASVQVVLPDGPLQPAAENRVWVVLSEEGRPLDGVLPTLAAEGGLSISTDGRVAEGVFAFRLQTGAQPPGEALLRAGLPSGQAHSFAVPVALLPEPTLDAPRRVDAQAGSGRPVVLTFRGDSPASHLVVRSSEGSVRSLKDTDDGVEVTLDLGPDRFPRTALVGAQDPFAPGTPPRWVVVRLSGVARIPVHTEPGARVTLQSGGRTVGPFVADASGEALVSLHVDPGERAAEVWIEDQSGNTQKTTLNLQSSLQPTLAMLEEPARTFGSSPAPVWLAALDAFGRPWSGATPTCNASPGGPLAVASLGSGQYRVSPPRPPSEGFLAIKVECELPGTSAHAQARIPLGQGVPHSLSLRAYPPVLSSDLPLAQFQLVLEDLAGERLPPRGVEVGADLGTVTLGMGTGLSLQGDYDGARAGSAGKDRLWARYAIPAGQGPPGRVQVFGGAVDAGRLEVLARVWDTTGHPLAGLTVLVAGQEAVTDSRGWARGVIPRPPDGQVWILEARLGALTSRMPWFPGAPSPPPPLLAHDLEAVQELTITSGRVREIFLRAEPSVLETGAGASSRVTVRLVDRAGRTILDDRVQVQASEGAVEDLKQGPDGSWEGSYAPPAGLRSGSVQISATSSDGGVVASTDLRLVPRPLSTAFGISAGYQSNLRSYHGPTAEILLESRLPVMRDRLVARLGVGWFQDEALIQDEQVGSTVTVHSQMDPISLSLLVRQEKGLWANWMGAGLVVLAWTSETTYGQDTAIDGTGLSGPGFQLLGGGGWRVGVGEVGAEVRYLQVGAGDGAIRYRGQLGGVALLTGYRVLF